MCSTSIPSTPETLSASSLSDLPIRDTSPGGSCGCCTPQQATESSATTKDAVTAEYSVTGLTCGSCAGRVSSALTALDGVQDVQITLVPGGTSTVSVISGQSLDQTSVQDVVEKAGYQLTTI